MKEMINDIILEDLRLNISKIVQDKTILNELDFQVILRNYIELFFRNKSAELNINQQIHILNTFRMIHIKDLVKSEQVNRYPDLIVFIEFNPVLILELKFFRETHKYNKEEIKKDLINLRNSLNIINKGKYNHDKTKAGQIILEQGANHRIDSSNLKSNKEFDDIEIIHHSIGLTDNQIFTYKSLKKNIDRNQLKSFFFL